MKRVIVLLLLLVACAQYKDTMSFPEKCNASGHSTWRYAYTEYWSTEEPVYEYHYDWHDGEWKYGYNGTETVRHQRDVYTCQRRR